MESPFGIRSLTGYLGIGGQGRLARGRLGSVSLGRVVVVAFILLIILLLFQPLSPFVIDLLIFANIFCSISLVLMVVMAPGGVFFPSFPSLILCLTLFRLALNIATTRLILMKGDTGTDAAGDVIQALGLYVVGGDLLVGLVVFLLVAIVNLLVVSRGSSRTAEVAARFALDSLPGRQLAIDTDVRSGNITGKDGVRERATLSDQSQFFGAMDGAMRFVQGDAVASLVIAGLCLSGGIFAGLSRGMALKEAILSFGVLAVGDGLATIIPCLLVSTAAGLVVTRFSNRGLNTVDQLRADFFSEPAILCASSATLVLIGLLSPLPTWPALLIAIIVLTPLFFFQTDSSAQSFALSNDLSSEPGSLLRYLSVHKREQEFSRDNRGYRNPRQVQDYAADSRLGSISTITLELHNEQALEEVRAAKDKLGDPQVQASGLLGSLIMPLPSVELTLNQHLGPGEFRILIRGRESYRGIYSLNASFVVCNTRFLDLLGYPIISQDVHPISHLTGAWLRTSEELESLVEISATVLSSAQYVLCHVIRAAQNACDEVIGFGYAHEIVERFLGGQQSLVTEVFTSKKVSYAEFAELLRKLIHEGVSTQDTALIVEGIAEFTLFEENDSRQEWLAGLHAHIRRRLGRGILQDWFGSTTVIRVFLVENAIEEAFRQIIPHKQGQLNALDPEFEYLLRDSASKLFLPCVERGALPVIIFCSADIREQINAFCHSLFGVEHVVRTLAFDELRTGYRIEPVGLLAVPTDSN